MEQHSKTYLKVVNKFYLKLFRAVNMLSHMKTTQPKHQCQRASISANEQTSVPTSITCIYKLYNLFHNRCKINIDNTFKRNMSLGYTTLHWRRWI